MAIKYSLGQKIRKVSDKYAMQDTNTTLVVIISNVSNDKKIMISIIQ